MKLRIQLKKSYKLEVIVFQFVLFYGLFSGYLEHINLWNYALVFIFLLLIIVAPGFKEHCFARQNFFCFLLIAILAYIIINTYILNDTTYLSDNILAQLYPFLIALILFSFSGYAGYETTKFFKTNFIVLNSMWIINLFILSRQLTGSGFMIKQSWLLINSFYPDQCSGLFGNSATHELGFFSIFIVIYNLYYSDYVLDAPKKKNALRLFTILTAILMLYYSTGNDNAALFLMMPAFILFYYLLKVQRISSVSVIGFIRKLVFIVTVILIVIIVFRSQPMNEFLNELVLSRLSGVFQYSNNTALGSDERLAIPAYSLSNGWGWKLGRGLGAWRWHLGGYMGFPHFGLSSIGSFITLGGVWYYILYSLLYGTIAARLLFRANKGKNIIWSIAVTIIVVTVSIFTNLYTNCVSTIWIMLIFLLLGEEKKALAANTEKKQENRL